MKDTKIALGTWAWGSGAFGGDAVYGVNTNEDNLKPVFEAATKAGLGLWDTATVYAMGDSERILGQFVASVPRERRAEPLLAALPFERARRRARLLSPPRHPLLVLHGVGAGCADRQLLARQSAARRQRPRPQVQPGARQTAGPHRRDEGDRGEVRRVMLADRHRLGHRQGYYAHRRGHEGASCGGGRYSSRHRAHQG